MSVNWDCNRPLRNSIAPQPWRDGMNRKVEEDEGYREHCRERDALREAWEAKRSWMMEAARLFALVYENYRDPSGALDDPRIEGIANYYRSFLND